MGDSRSFGAQVPNKGHIVRGSGGLQGEVADLRGDVDDGFLELEKQVMSPAASQANLRLNVQATEGDTIVIGADTYEFVDTLGAGVAGGIEVLVGGSAANQRTNIVGAINRTAAIGTDCDGHGTENILASLYNTDFLHIVPAKFPGGTAVLGTSPSIALSETLTDSAIWDHQNLSRLGYAGALKREIVRVVVDAVNLANDFDVVLPFTPMLAQVFLVTNASDVKDGTGKSATLTLVPARNAVTVDLNGTGTDPIATDIVYLEIHGI